jgi:hypothetical protein
MGKKKVAKTIHLEPVNAEWFDKESIKLTKTAHGRSAVANEAFSFIRANIVSFEAWWDNRDRGDKG